MGPGVYQLTTSKLARGLWSEYLEISEGLHLRILEIIGQEGAELAYPTRTVNMEGVAPEKKQTV
jgi:small-conductance mechanosensitive channel